MESCPVPLSIRGVTDTTDSNNSTTTTTVVCPITGAKLVVAPATELDFAEFEENPSYQEYKKIKRVMSMITRFYIAGSDAKKGNYDAMAVEIAKLDTDMDMLNAQLAALELTPSFGIHPKVFLSLFCVDFMIEKRIQERSYG